MLFAKFLVIIVRYELVLNVTAAGEVIKSHCDDLPMIEFLSKELGFTYKVYSSQFKQDGDLMLANMALSIKLFKWSTYPFAVQDFTFAVMKPNYLPNAMASLRPFMLPVWIMILLSVILMTLAKFVIFRRKVPLQYVIFYASAALLGKHRDWKPKSNAQKLLVLTWSVCVNFLTFAYVAVILSFMMFPDREKGITNVDELYDAIIKGESTVVTFTESELGEAFMHSGSEKLKLIGNLMHNQRIVTKLVGGNFLDVIKPSVAVVGQRDLLEILYSGDEHFISTDSFSYYFRTMMYWDDRFFPYMDQINAVIHRIWGTGLYKKSLDILAFQTKLFYRLKFPDSYSRDENPMPLTLSGMSGAFYLLIIGNILGLICLLCEIIFHRYNRAIKKIPNIMHKMFRKLKYQ